MHAKCNSHLVHILEMVELARDTKASAHSPWGVYPTAWVLGWATNTLLTHPTAVVHSAPDTDSAVCGWFVGVVRWCAHHLQQLGPPWGTGPICPHTPGITGHCLITLGDHTHHHRSHTQRRRHHIRRFELRYGGVWCGGSVVVRRHHGIGGLGVPADGDGVG